MDLDGIKQLARELAQREQDHLAMREQNLENIRRLHTSMALAVDAFEKEAEKEGAEFLRLSLTEPSADIKDIRAFQFYLSRGRIGSIVVALPGNRFRLVGPFKQGSEEGPCQEVSMDSEERNAKLYQLLAEVIQQGFAVKAPKKK